MAVKIRMKRLGTKKRPFYRIVVSDSRSPRDGRFIEEIGYYNPISEPKQFKVDADKAVKWMTTGAKPTETVARLFKTYNVVEEAGKTKVEETPVVEEKVEEVKEEAPVVEETVEEVKEEAPVVEEAVEEVKEEVQTEEVEG